METVGSRRSRVLKGVERLCTFAGGAGLIVVAVAYLHAAFGSHSAVAAFEQAVEHQTRTADLTTHLTPPDQTLWSENAKQKYLKSSGGNAALPVALLQINRLGLQVPVFVGTDAITLNRGAGIVEGTALPGENGNVVISAHRDSFFRSLKDIAVGDAIELRTLDGFEHFRVAEISITDPLDVSVLDDTPSSTLTLITCYPFYYLGFAPDRYIVRAVPVSADVATRASNQTVAATTAAGGNQPASTSSGSDAARVFDETLETTRRNKK